MEIPQGNAYHYHSLETIQASSTIMQPMGGYQMKPKLQLPRFNDETKKTVAWINKGE